MSTTENETGSASVDDAQLQALGYEQKFQRGMSLWSTFALGFLYLSPLVGVIALFGLGLTKAGPPAVFWIVVVLCGQLLVALVFGEIVAQYPIAGGLYQWARRLWSGRYAWWLSWVYLAGVTVGITTTALFSADFVASLLFGTAEDPGAGGVNSNGSTFMIALVVTAVCLLLNATGTRTLARIASIGLAAELVGVIAVGIYLLVFSRKQPFSVLFDAMGTGGEGGYAGAFVGAALVGLLLVYGFEACGEVAEEVPDPGRRIPRAMQMTVIVGAGSALFSFVGYVLAAPNLPAIVSGEIGNPIPAILQDSIGTVGTKLFLVVALTSFLACVMGQQAAGSRLVFSFARDDMFPGAATFSKISRRQIPLNALLAVNVLPLLLYVYAYFADAGAIFRIASFQMLAGYLAFQLVVLAALRARIKGWRPAGQFTLGRAGYPVTIAALVYGVLSMVVLALPGDASLPFVDRWIALIGVAVVAVSGLLYLLIAQPDKASTAPEGDAIEVANRIRGEA